MMQRSDEEFWNATPSKIYFCIGRYAEVIGNKTPTRKTNETKEIHSMHEIAGWGCNGN